VSDGMLRIESDISASYKDGILEIRVPVADQPTPKEPTRIAISKN
jgi:HSP20 family protein